MKHRGFTLIELLVVIAIIAILAAILFPVFARARENARKSTCQSNQKQLGLGFLQYVQDYDETFPGRSMGVYGAALNTGQLICWPGLITPYVKNTGVFMCPSYASTYTAYAWQGTTPTTITGNIGYNYCGLNNAATNGSCKLAIITKPAEVPLIADSVCAGLKSTGTDARNCLYIGPGTNTASYPDQIHPRMKAHMDGINISFCDGHVKWHRSSAVGRGTFWALK